jgi:2,3-bisphosphoglycerate-dependent phosphoglycerate mutase
MIIYIIRHEDRTQDATMFSPLTELGLENSVKLIETINDIKINKIYSSPFIRTLQTIHPFSKKYDIKINIDYALSELQHPDLIPPNSFKVFLPKYLGESFNYNEKYTSSIQPTEYTFPEKGNDLKKRVKKFISKIINNNSQKEDKILLSTHQGVCNYILKLISKHGDTKLQNINSKYKYPKGGITKVFDKNKWVFEPINWEF